MCRVIFHPYSVIILRSTTTMRHTSSSERKHDEFNGVYLMSIIVSEGYWKHLHHEGGFPESIFCFYWNTSISRFHISSGFQPTVIFCESIFIKIPNTIHSTKSAAQLCRCHSAITTRVHARNDELLACLQQTRSVIEQSVATAGNERRYTDRPNKRLINLLIASAATVLAAD